MNIRNLAGFALGPIGTAAISLMTVPITAWYFSAEDIGRISMLQIGISFCLLLFSLGLDQAYVREYHDTENKAGLFKATILPGFSLLLIVLLSLFLWPEELSSLLFKISNSEYSALAGLCFITAFLGRFLSLILRMQERGLAFSISQLLPKIGFLIVLGFYVLQQSQLGLGQLLIAHAIAQVSVCIVFAWNTRNEWYKRTTAITTSHRIALFRFGMPLVFSGCAFWGMTSMDKIFLRHYSSYEELGLYSIATSFAGVAIVLQNIFSTIWAPTAYKWHSEGVDPRSFQKMIDHVLAAVVALFALAGLLSWVITYILPVQYHNAQYILLACLVYPLLYSLGETTGIGLGIARKSRHTLLATVVALCVNVVCNFWLVPLYGAAGAASATALSFLALFIFRTEFGNRYWVPFSRTKIYLYIFTCTILSINQTLLGCEKLDFLFHSTWATILIYIGFSYIKNSHINRKIN